METENTEQAVTDIPVEDIVSQVEVQGEVVQSETVQEGSTSIYVVSLPTTADTDTEADTEVDLETEEVPASSAMEYASVDEASDGGAISEVVHTLFGDYCPRTQTVTVVAADGSTAQSTQVVPGVAGLDFYWLAAVVLFGLMLHSLFAFMGVVFKHG